jgi:hypothetical protein
MARELPDDCGGIVAGRGQIVAIGGKCHTVDLVGVLLQHCELLAIRGPPETNGVVLGSGCKHATVAGERDAPDTSFVPAQRCLDLARLHVADLHTTCHAVWRF